LARDAVGKGKHLFACLIKGVGGGAGQVAEGRQWALPFDTAAQVLADLVDPACRDCRKTTPGFRCGIPMTGIQRISLSATRSAPTARSFRRQTR